MPSVLYANAQNRFVLMMLSVLRLSSTDCTTWPSEDPMTVMSAASRATSVPDPMAIPRSACASAGASFTPSPTMATTRPAACSSLTLSTFSSGRTPAKTSSRDIPTTSATWAATAALSPVSRIGRSPSSRNRAMARAEVSFTVSCREMIPASTPSTDTQMAVAPADSASARACSCSASSAPELSCSAMKLERPAATERPST